MNQCLQNHCGLGKLKFGIRKIGCSMSWTRYKIVIRYFRSLLTFLSYLIIELIIVRGKGRMPLECWSRVYYFNTRVNLSNTASVFTSLHWGNIKKKWDVLFHGVHIKLSGFTYTLNRDVKIGPLSTIPPLPQTFRHPCWKIYNLV